MRVLITGGNKGIGSYIVKSFLKNGHDVVTLSLTRSEDDPKAQWHKIDLRNIDALKRFLSKEEPFDILVLNAAIIGNQGKESKDDWSDVVAINYLANATLIYHAPINSEGRIIGISSVHGATGVKGASAYASTKGAFELLVRSAGLEMVKRGITVNAIRLGFMDTGMFHRLPDKYQELYKSRIPMGHAGDPKHLASFIHYLCTAPECGYITGQVITYDGGYMANWWGD